MRNSSTKLPIPKAILQTMMPPKTTAAASLKNLRMWVSPLLALAGLAESMYLELPHQYTPKQHICQEVSMRPYFWAQNAFVQLHLTFRPGSVDFSYKWLRPRPRKGAN